jgi:hypothetical protein
MVCRYSLFVTHDPRADGGLVDLVRRRREARSSGGDG